MQPACFLLVDQRQVDLESGALADRGLDRDVAAGPLHDAVDHGEAEAGALAELLGGEEGLEDVLEHLRRDAGAGVGDRHQRPAGRAAPRCGRPPLSIVLRLVVTAIRPSLSIASLALTTRLSSTCSSWPGSTLTGSFLRCRFQVQVDAAGEHPPQQVLEPLDQLAEVDQLLGGRLPAAEGEQLGGERRRLFGRLADAAEVAGEARDRSGRARRAARCSRGSPTGNC